LRKYHIAVDEIVCDTVSAGHAHTRITHCGVIFDEDHDFGEIDVIDSTGKYETNDDTDRGIIQVETLPSQKIDINSLSCLTEEQQTKLLAVLDKYSCCFSDKPGLCKIIEHEISVSQS